ncbi:MAG: hypothetical protein IPN44_10370 [Flavobacteriales bacterium]|nr:hypothetical protein [Flavobacteriales bacterium]
MAIVTAQAAAQSVAVDTISAMQPWSPYKQFTFPHVIVHGQPGLSARIDRDLCVDFLDVDPDTAKGSIFQMVWGDPEGQVPQRLNSLTWSYNEPLPEVLSVLFSGEGCGAYCEEFTIHYNYDLRDGHRLSFDSLFTKNGAIAVDDTLRRSWRRDVEARIELVQDSSEVTGLSADNRERWQEESDMYRECLLERKEQRPYVQDFEPLTKELRVHIARCSAHYNRALDDLNEVSTDVPYEWLAPFFRPGYAALFMN